MHTILTAFYALVLFFGMPVGEIKYFAPVDTITYQAEDPLESSVLLWIHGGGWSDGDKYLNTPFDHTAYQFLDAGYTVVSLGYEPGSMYTSVSRALNDLYEYDNIVVGGYSSGGHLASWVGTNWERVGLRRPDIVFSMAGPLDPVTWYDTAQYLTPKSDRVDMLSLVGPNANVVDAADKHDPPQVLVYSHNDEVVPTSSQVASVEALSDAGVMVMTISSKENHVLADMDNMVAEVESFMAQAS
jgi:acetyl esterase/lipase